MKAERIIVCADQPYSDGVEELEEAVLAGFTGTNDAIRFTWTSRSEPHEYVQVRNDAPSDEAFVEGAVYSLGDKVTEHPED